MQSVRCALWVVAVTANLGSSAVIRGVVTDQNSIPIAGGIITAADVGRGAAGGSKSHDFSASSSISTTGTFQFTSLVAGVYRLCIQEPGTIWLNTCEWGQSGTVLTLSDDQASANVTIIPVKGAQVNVQVSDPNRLLSIHEGKTLGAHLLIGITTDAFYFRPAQVIAQTDYNRTYQLTVPLSRTIDISVASSFYRFSDALGRILPSFGYTFPVIALPGQQAPAIVLTLNGLN